MNNKTNNAVLEEQFIKECRPVFMKKIYPEDTSGIKFIVTSDLAEEILEGIYADILDKYRPYVIISTDMREIIDRDRKDEWKEDFNRRLYHVSGDIEDMVDVESGEDTPEECLIREEQYKELYAALKKIPPLNRRRIEMYFFDNFTIDEIAMIESKDRSVIKRTIKQGLKQLRRFIH